MRGKPVPSGNGDERPDSSGPGAEELLGAAGRGADIHGESYADILVADYIRLDTNVTSPMPVALPFPVYTFVNDPAASNSCGFGTAGTPGAGTKVGPDTRMMVAFDVAAMRTSTMGNATDTSRRSVMPTVPYR